jgi:phosphoglycolate phosphatase
VTIEAVLFDKDGTLFDFRASWTDWMHDLVEDLSGGDRARARAIEDALGFDAAERRFAPDSVVIAGTLRQSLEALAPVLPDWPQDRLRNRLEHGAATVRMVPAVPLAPVLAELRTHVSWLGVATNAGAAEAAAHLEAAGIAAAFDMVAGCDSGYGAKPDPGMCLAFAEAVGVAPERVVMVGDSLHDLHAGRAAGMRVAGVLTGLAPEARLAPHADVVLADIGQLPAWLAAQNSAA